ncbi:hypothetical protein [Saccharothrix sp. HUAS TT1]|uniref:hypothetical protein n=1 Tax=unclassified Saccharothrix TaxID=2593673 RepID=UPI00345C1BFD
MARMAGRTARVQTCCRSCVPADHRADPVRRDRRAGKAETRRAALDAAGDR